MAKRKIDQSQTSGPYTEQDYVELRSVRDGIARLLPDIAAAESCGVKCEEFRAIASEIDSQLAQIELRFMQGYSQ